MDFYLYIKAIHVLAVILFIGGLIGHDRIVSVIVKYPQSHQASTLEALHQIDQRFTTPALFFTWILGLFLAVYGEWFPSPWLVVKLLFVVVLSALHGMQSGRLRRSIRDEQTANIIPWAGIIIVISVLAIVVLVIVKPI